VNFKNLALIPFVLLVALIAVTIGFGFTHDFVYNPPYLLLGLNVSFYTIATIAISVISARSFLKEGSVTVLLIGCSIFIFGVPVIASGWVQTFSVNQSIAISNPCILAASILQVISSLLAFQGKEETKTLNRKRLLATAYLASLIFVLANSIVALLGYYPMFFLASGPTLLRQVVLGSAVFFFAVAALVFGVQYLRSKSPSLYWYALAIGLFSVGLFSAFEQKTIGDVPTWLGRAALYAGTIYLLAAIISTRAKSGKSDIASAWAQSFRTNPNQITTFFSNMLNGFAYCKILTNKDRKPIDYIFLDVNKAFENLTGLKKENVLGKKASEVMKIDALEDWLSVVGPVALTGEPVTIDHFSKFSQKWAHLSVYSPQKEYFVSISEDISERKKAEETIKEYQTNLEKLVEERTKQLKDSERLATIGATAGMVGHDIRNPLQAITGDLFLARAELSILPDNEQKANAIESLAEIEKNIDYINKIVADLQDYARPLNPRVQETSIKLVFEEILAKNGIPKNIEVDLRVEEKAETIKADADFIKRIISNLTLNAVQAMPEGGKLTIHAYVDKVTNDVLITVKDTGVGIPEDIKPKLFTPMMTTKSKGQGFGLAVVKRMTEGLGGTVTFESTEGKGTTFIVRFPPPRS
jgi:PAS domain S-box-containing protein